MELVLLSLSFGDCLMESGRLMEAPVPQYLKMFSNNLLKSFLTLPLAVFFGSLPKTSERNGTFCSQSSHNLDDDENWIQ